MTELADILNRDIYPLVFERIDILFPEFEFKRKGSSWVSSNTLKVDGTYGDSKGRVYVYQDHPHYIKDFRSSGCEITKYLQDRGITTSWLDSIKFLAKEVGYQLPDTTNIQHDNKQTAPIRTNIYEALNDLFVETLSKEPKDGKHWKYLNQRGYAGLLSCEDTASETYKMELGLAPSREVQKRYLLECSFTKEEINDNYFSNKEDNKSFEVNKSIGTNHTLTLPYRDISGRLIGFVVRNLDYKKGDKNPKYIVTKGLSRADKLFNLTLRKNLYEEVTMVEGYLDALSAKALGMPNVVALGSVGFNNTQAKLLEAMGTKTVTLALDQDGSGKNSTGTIIETLRKECPSIKIYVIPSYNGYKDPDELIRALGIEAFRNIIKMAKPWYSYKLDNIFNNIQSKTILPMERDQLIEESYSLGVQITNATERNLYSVELISKLAIFGILPQTIETTLKELWRQASEDESIKRLEKDLKKAGELLVNGQRGKAIDLLSNVSKQEKIATLETRYQELTHVITEDDLIAKLKQKPDAIKSGYTVSKNSEAHDLLIPTGALSVFTAQTGHGKTMMLNNLALNILANHPEKKIHYFTYEENKESIIVRIMNSYMSMTLSYNNKRSLEAYYRGDHDTQCINEDIRSNFLLKKKTFFDMINTGRFKIHDGTFSAQELINAIYYLKQQGDVTVVVIDYMQLLETGDTKSNSRQEELKNICKKLKDCANETGITFIVAAQFNREVTAPNKMHSTKIGEAGDIERIANLIVGLWNYTNPSLGADKAKPEEFIPEEKILLEVLKDRDGGLVNAIAILPFNGKTGKIENRLEYDCSLNPLSAKKEDFSIPFDKPSLNHAKTKGGRKKKYPIHEPLTAREYREKSRGH